MPPAPLQPDDPRTVGRFRLTGRLGEGGQGVVYLGEGPAGERVAVKTLKTTDESARARFAREMAAAQRVAPFCTAAVLDASADAAVPYVVSEYIDGPSLQDRVLEQGPLREGELQRLAVNTASALAAIHGAGIVHRDLKPANVLLGPDGPRVVDFGIARAIDAETHTQLVGTPAYFAPEWLEGHPPTDKSDVFAWAGTIVYAATGRPPFGPADSIPAVMHRIANGEPDLGGVPPWLAPLLTVCLAKDPARRPTARDLMVRLVDPSAERGPAPVPGPVPPPPPPGGAAQVPPAHATEPPRRRTGRRTGRRVAVPAAVVAAIALLAGGLLAFDALDDDTRDAPPAASSSSPPTPSKTPTNPTNPTNRPTSPSPSPSETSDGPLPDGFAGTWTGEITQTGGITIGDASTPVTIELDDDGEGTADYTGWGCRMSLSLIDAGSARAEFRERVEDGTGITGFCTGGRVTLERESGGLRYTSTGTGDIRGRLGAA
ncbi:serine/threonine-protein kinase [Actinomadura sp. WMMB 499]|uniref:serine/threonine-protein kinase n=1 Tax=Actinomadura sp. WMMB 499 TaxID=1219491 RepID=UPI00124845DE|nr:serine/threonine-protein kinase [Actinomadura sp. WMMB 499]QFG25234.1 serine/threonine protein kinase [Actinomadura sp. WMMB 499]